jgi:hypothetical protein
MRRFRHACDQLRQLLESKPDDQDKIRSHLAQLVGSLTWKATPTSDALEQERAIWTMMTGLPLAISVSILII